MVILYDKRYFGYHSLRWEEDLGREPSLRSCFRSTRENSLGLLDHAWTTEFGDLNSSDVFPSMVPSFFSIKLHEIYLYDYTYYDDFAQNRSDTNRKYQSTRNTDTNDRAESKQIVNVATLCMLHDITGYLYCI